MAEPARVHPPRAAPWVESSDDGSRVQRSIHGKDGEFTGDGLIVFCFDQPRSHVDK